MSECQILYEAADFNKDSSSHCCFVKESTYCIRRYLFFSGPFFAVGNTYGNEGDGIEGGAQRTKIKGVILAQLTSSAIDQ